MYVIFGAEAVFSISNVTSVVCYKRSSIIITATAEQHYGIMIIGCQFCEVANKHLLHSLRNIFSPIAKFILKLSVCFFIYIYTSTNLN